ncbi:MAG TPA: RNA polymerase sigma factor RpoD/SigA [Opitutaceae bacterium]|nr:RNA polymerase sigma factor RpoD/SigA [Opitutaceae bacterium]
MNPLGNTRFETDGTRFSGARPRKGVSADDESVESTAPDSGRGRVAPPSPPVVGERSTIKQYLQEIGQVPLLTPEQEVQLAKRIHRGDRSARDLMIKSNLRLVVKIAHDYKDFGLPLLDLISEGNIGLIKAVERFDPAKGGKLSTYAAWWIKQSIKRALANQSKTIRLPVHLVDKISKMRRVANALTEELGREPTEEEIAIELQIPTAKVAHLKSVSTRPASLDAPISDEDGGTPFGEIVGDENAIDPYENLREKNLQADLRALLDGLDERESEIIKLRFGLEGKDELTLEEVGKKFNVTRERVRQLQNIAITKMRRAMANIEHQRTQDEIDEEDRLQKRMDVLREFFESRSRRPAPIRKSA